MRWRPFGGVESLLLCCLLGAAGCPEEETKKKETKKDSGSIDIMSVDTGGAADVAPFDVTAEDATGDDVDLAPDGSLFDAGRPDIRPADIAIGDAAAVAVTIYDIQNESSLNHPAVDTAVAVSDVIVTAVYPSRGFWVQESEGGVFSGIFVYLPLGSSYDPSVLRAGDIVSLSGVYKEVLELSSIELADIEASGQTSPPEPLLVSDLAAAAEDYEGVLVQVCGDCEVLADPNFLGIAETSCGTVGKLLHDYEIRAGEHYRCLAGVWHYLFQYILLPRSDRDLVPMGGEDAGMADILSGDVPGEDVANRDTGVEDAASEDATVKDGTGEDATSKDATSEDTTGEDATGEDVTSRDTGAEDS